MAVISPFIGRVKDWWAAREPKIDGRSLSDQPLSEHPGILLVQQIRSAYASYGHRTEIMAAGFRRVEEIVELGKRGSRGGPDIVTLPPDLLAGLRDRVGVIAPSDFQNVPEITPEPVYISPEGPTLEGEAAYAQDIENEMIALDKVPEGLAKFSVDAKILEDLIRSRIEGNVEVSVRL
jgi:transaldolase